jgi:hypothetical protein
MRVSANHQIDSGRAKPHDSIRIMSEDNGEHVVVSTMECTTRFVSTLRSIADTGNGDLCPSNMLMDPTIVENSDAVGLESLPHEPKRLRPLPKPLGVM